MAEREYNTEHGTIDCHYFAKDDIFWCVITQVVDDFETDNVIFEGEGKTHELAKQNAIDKYS
jgi:hypothetical protein